MSTILLLRARPCIRILFHANDSTSTTIDSHNRSEMKFTAVIWDEENDNHRRENRRYSRRDIEDVIRSTYYPSRVASVRHEADGSSVAILEGTTFDGRTMAAVVKVLPSNSGRPLTAFSLDGRKRKSYTDWRDNVKKRRSRQIRSNPDALPEWPTNKPTPSFRSLNALRKFYMSYSFSSVMEERGEEVERSTPARKRRSSRA